MCFRGDPESKSNCTWPCLDNSRQKSLEKNRLVTLLFPLPSSHPRAFYRKISVILSTSFYNNWIHSYYSSTLDRDVILNQVSRCFNQVYVWQLMHVTWVCLLPSFRARKIPRADSIDRFGESRSSREAALPSAVFIGWKIPQPQVRIEYA